MNVSNITRDSSFCKNDVPDTDIVRTAKVMAILLVGGFGIFGNVFIIFLAVKYIVRKNIHYLIINMAVSDVLVVLVLSINILMDLFGYNLLEHIHGTVANILCKLNAFLMFTSVLVTLVTLLIISIERFRVTRSTVHRIRPYRLTQRVAVISCSWLIPIGLCADVLYNLNIVKRENSQYCRPTDSARHLNFLSFFYICYFVLVCAILLLSILTSVRLRQSQAIQANLPDVERQARAKRTANAVRMVLCSLLLYSCCYLPFILNGIVGALSFHGLITIDYSLCTTDWSTIWFIIGYLLLLVNSCLSPCIYIVFLTDFREAAKKLLCEKPTNRNNNRRAVEPDAIELR